MQRLHLERMAHYQGGAWQCEMLVGAMLGSSAGVLTPAGPIFIVTFAMGLAFKATNACGY